MIDLERYTRQISLEEVGVEGQEKLQRASVLIVGLGGLGSPISMLLASSGVGRLGIVDFDTVSLSNLPRQLLYNESDLSKPKVECAAARLRAMNSELIVEQYMMRLDSESAREIISRYDIVVDGTDNLEARYIIDEVAHELQKPYVYGAIQGFVGQISVFNCHGAGSYSDLFPREDAPECSVPPPVMATTPSIIGALEANEVLKLIVGYGESLCGRLLTLDSRNYQFNIFEI